jgi:hypothetical protein
MSSQSSSPPTVVDDFPWKQELEVREVLRNMPKEEYRKIKPIMERKRHKRPPWTAEMCQAAAAAADPPEPRYPIIISTPQGLFPTREKLQECVGSEPVSEIQSTIRTPPLGQDENTEESEKPEGLRYCDVSWDQYDRLRHVTEGEHVAVWFQGIRRDAWLAYSAKQTTG